MRNSVEADASDFKTARSIYLGGLTLLTALVLVAGGSGCNSSSSSVTTYPDTASLDNGDTVTLTSSPTAANPTYYDPTFNYTYTYEGNGLYYNDTTGVYEDGQVLSSFQGSSGSMASGDFVHAAVAGANLASPAAMLVGAGPATADDSANLANSVGGGTKDVSLQLAQLNDSQIAQRAQSVANEFGMDLGHARQLVSLAGRVQEMSAKGPMTDADRDAIAGGFLSIAGISKDEVNDAILSAEKTGQPAAINALTDKVAKNLGMPSGADVTRKLLPAIGIQF